MAEEEEEESMEEVMVGHLMVPQEAQGSYL